MISRRRRWHAILFLVVALPVACRSDKGTAPLGPSAIALVAGDNQTGPVGQALPQPLIVQVTDKNGGGVAAATVVWVVTGGGGTLSRASTQTDDQGQTQVTWTPGTVAGTHNNTVAASASGLTGSPVTFTASATAGAPAQLVAVSGNGQTGLVGQVLSQPLVVAIQDQYGNAAAGVAVGWDVTAGGGSPSAASATTDSLGDASVTWTLGTVAGVDEDTLEATVSGLTGSPADFAASANPAAAAQLTLSAGDGQTAAVGSTLPQPLTVTAQDSYANPVGGVTIAWAVTSGGGALSAVTVVTDSQGQASATWTLGFSAGQQQASASAPGLTGSPITFTANATVGDTAPPTLTAFDFTPKTINTDSGPASVTATFTMTDDLSGATSIFVQFQAPTTPTTASGTSVFAAATSYTGSVQVSFPQFSEAGTWTVLQVVLEDAAGNRHGVSSADLAASGFPTTLTVTGGGDSVPPTLTAFDFTPTTISTDSGPASVTVTFTMTDDVSGATSFFVQFQAPTSFATTSGTSVFAPATSYAGSVQVSFPQFSEAGTWTVLQVIVEDAAGNRHGISTAGLAAAGFRTTLMVTGTGDATPPTLTAFDFAPKSISTANGPASVTVTFTMTDDISGATSFFVQFQAPTSFATAGGTSVFAPATSYSGSVQVSFPQFSEVGTWTVLQVIVEDAAGNRHGISGADLAASGFPTMLTVTS